MNRVYMCIYIYRYKYYIWRERELLCKMLVTDNLDEVDAGIYFPIHANFIQI